MLETIKSKLQDEQVQRALLSTAGMIGTLVVTKVVAGVCNKGIEAGINALMEKWHPTTEVPAE